MKEIRGAEGMSGGKNHEGYSDPTANLAVGHVSKKAKKRKRRKAGRDSEGRKNGGKSG